jgi:hypothetical protein
MRIFFAVVGVLAWLWALTLLVLFSETGGQTRFVAAGIYAIVAVLALGVERILKTLEDIRDGRVYLPAPGEKVVVTEPVGGRPVVATTEAVA